MRISTPCLGIAAALLLTTAVQAHETWVQPVGASAVGQPTTLTLTSGAKFPDLETGPKAERVAKLTGDIDGAVQPVGVGAEAPEALSLTLTPDRAGLAVVAVALAPRDIDLTAAEVPEYFAEADPPIAVRQAWNRIAAAGGTWRETYIKNAKALVCVADCKGGRGGIVPAGQTLEFIALETGPAPRRFRLLAKSQPLADQPVRLALPGAPEQKLATNGLGEIVLPSEVKGPLMLSTVWLRAPDKADGRFLSDFASLVLGVPTPAPKVLQPTPDDSSGPGR